MPLPSLFSLKNLSLLVYAGLGLLLSVLSFTLLIPTEAVDSFGEGLTGAATIFLSPVFTLIFFILFPRLSFIENFFRTILPAGELADYPKQSALEVGIKILELFLITFFSLILFPLFFIVIPALALLSLTALLVLCGKYLQITHARS